MRPATPDDAALFAPRLRESDRREIVGLMGEEIEQGLRRSIAESEWAVVASIGGEPVYVSGKSMFPTGAGCPWLVGTDLIAQHRREFLRTTRLLTARMVSESPLLINLVAAENETSIRWLRWLGFDVRDDNPIVVREGGLPFFIFTLEAP